MPWMSPEPLPAEASRSLAVLPHGPEPDLLEPLVPATEQVAVQPSWLDLVQALGSLAFLMILAELLFRGLPGMTPAILPEATRDNGAALLLCVASFVLLHLAGVAVHEGGHAMAARRVGFRLISLWVGPLQVARSSGRWRLRWSNRFRSGGACLSVPTHWMGERELRRSLFRFIAGGPAASLSIGGAGLALFAVLRAGGVVMDGSWQAFVLVLGSVLCLLQGSLSLFPARGLRRTDGAWLLRLRAGRGEVPCLGLLYLSQAQRPREWNPELVARVEAVRGEMEDDLAIAVMVALSCRSLDLGNFREARDWLQRAIGRAAASSMSGARKWRIALAGEAALFEVVWRHDAVAARRWLRGVKVTRRARALDPQGGLLIRAALAFAEGDRDGAARAFAEAQTALRSGLPGDRLMRAATLERLSSKLENS